MPLSIASEPVYLALSSFLLVQASLPFTFFGARENMQFEKVKKEIINREIVCKITNLMQKRYFLQKGRNTVQKSI